MSSTGKNFVFAYAFLVVLPLVGLAGILRSGRSLHAPATIDGPWALRLDPPSNSAACANFWTTLSEKPLSLSQSGTGFVLSLPGAPAITGSGTLDGATLHASFDTNTAVNTGCNGHAVTMAANRDLAGKLSGTFAIADCPSCPPVGFLAERPAPDKGGH